MVRLRQAEVFVGQVAICITQEVGVKLLDHRVQTIAQGDSVACVGLPLHADTRLDAGVLRQQEVAAGDAEVQAEALGGLPQVRPVDAGQSGVVLRGIIGSFGHRLIDVLGGAEAQVEETVRILAAKLREPAGRELLRQLCVHHHAVLVLLQVAEGIVLTLVGDGHQQLTICTFQPPILHIYLIVLHVEGGGGAPGPLAVEVNLVRDTSQCIKELAVQTGCVVDGVDVLDVQLHVPRLVVEGEGEEREGARMLGGEVELHRHVHEVIL